MEFAQNFFSDVTGYQDLALFFLRVVMAYLFIHSGYFKMKRIKDFSKQNGLHPFVGALVVFGELLGGIGLLFGVYTQLAALVIMVIMLGAIYKKLFVWKTAYWASKDGWEYDLIWVIAGFVILTSGGGALSLYPGF